MPIHSCWSKKLHESLFCSFGVPVTCIGVCDLNPSLKANSCIYRPDHNHKQMVIVYPSNNNTIQVLSREANWKSPSIYVCFVLDLHRKKCNYVCIDSDVGH